MSQPAAPIKCIRCRQFLPEGSYFCTACGCNCASALDERIVHINKQIESRRCWLEFWSSVADVFRWRFRRF
jgi:hypothetical protein